MKQSHTLNKIIVIMVIFTVTTWAVPVSNGEFATQMLDEIWNKWIDRNKDVNYGFQIVWDQEDDIASYLGQEMDNYLSKYLSSQPVDTNRVIVIAVQNARLDFQIRRSGLDSQGNQLYERSMQTAFDLLVSEKTSDAMVKNERFQNSKSDVIEESDLTYVIDDPFVVEPQIHFPVSSLSVPKIIMVSVGTLILVALLYFVRG